MTESPLVLPKDLAAKVNLARYQTKATLADARLVMNCLDLTSLTGKESDEDIKDLCNKAILYDLASVCVYPQYVALAAQQLRGTGVRTATVINYPTATARTGSDERATPLSTAQDIVEAIKNGANQVDIVQPFHNKRQGVSYEILSAARTATPRNATLKSILETAAYDDSRLLSDAARIAIMAGVDCIKTSTGKHANGGATLEAAAIMMDAIKQTNRRVGIKITGGVSTLEECMPYIALKQLFCGANSISPEKFRFGSSRLLENLVWTFLKASKGSSAGDGQSAANDATAPAPVVY